MLSLSSSRPALTRLPAVVPRAAVLRLLHAGASHRAESSHHPAANNVHPAPTEGNQASRNEASNVPETTTNDVFVIKAPGPAREGYIEGLAKQLLRLGVDGSELMKGSKALAEGYAYSGGPFATTETRINSLVQTETLKGFTSGFVTGVGGMFVMPVALPAAMVSGWVLQARMSGAIAHLYGFNVDKDEVRALILTTLLGQQGQRDVLKDVTTATSRKLNREFLAVRFPLSLVSGVQYAVAHRLATHGVTRGGVAGVSRAIPMVGGFVGGSMDALAMHSVANTARETFMRGPSESEW